MNRGASQTQGFSLIELVAVLILVSVLAAVAIPRLFNVQTFQLQAGRDQVLSALALAQQLAQSRTGSGTTVSFTASGANYDVQINGSSVTSGDWTFPRTLPAGVSLSAATLNYDGLGRTAATTLTLSSASGSVPIQVEASGYAY